MKRVMLALMLFVVSACTRIDAGHVGVVVEQFGDQKGVQDMPVRTGTIFYNPLTEDVYTFPTFFQTVNWSEIAKDKDDNGQHLVMQSIEGAVIKFDVTFTGAFTADSVPRVYVDFRKPADVIVNTYIRNTIREEFSNRANKMQVTDIFGPGRQSLTDSAKASVIRILGRRGIVVEQLAIVGDLRVDPKVQESINAVLTARQRGIEAETKVAQAKAEADQAIQTARGDSASAVIRATGQAEANRKLSASISNDLVAWETVKKWNGTLPTVTGGSTPMIDLRKP